MRRVYVLILFVLSSLFLLSQISSAIGVLRVNETAIKMTLLEENCEVSFPIENSSGKSFTAVIALELVAPSGAIPAKTVQNAPLNANTNAINLRLGFNYKSLKPDEQQKILWYRLHYRITPDASVQSSVNSIEGFVSLSQLLTDFFELRVTAPHKIRSIGGPVRVIARAIYPLSSRPISNIKVEGKIEFDNEEKFKPLTATGVSNLDGYAILDFNVPRNIEGEDELDLTVTAKRGEFEQEASEDIEVERDASILVSTDKTLYQPGQTLHLRALLFNSGNRALSDKTIKLELRDESYSVVHRDTLKTSRFGIAIADWTIPNDAKLGQYTFELELDDEHYNSSSAHYSVKISRYDLPNFVVNAKTDKPYYTPEQPAAETEVRADYLFGQPVKRGHVRVVREKERRWSYYSQKWETDEGENYEGDTDEQGRFIAKLDLKEEVESLKEYTYDKFRDLRYAAYFTDPTTNRTEQRRFDVRITKDPIHLYTVGLNYYQNKRLPADFFITTYYADGAPASCEVTINEELPKPSAEKSDEKILRPLMTIKTNRYGVAKVTSLKPQGGADNNEDRVRLVLAAKDIKGLLGHHSEGFSFNDDTEIRVNANKTLYSDGESITANIASTEENETAVVDLVSDYKVIRTKMVQMKDGQAVVTFPYGADFKGLLSVVAYLPQTQENWHYRYYYDLPIGAANVLYPHDQELKMNVKMNQTQYRPGDDALVNFAVSTPEGKSIESALGVVIFDKAVEERARTDAEFGSYFGFYSSMRKLLRDEGSAAGFSLRDLYKLDMSKPLPEGLDLLAELLVGTTYYNPRVFSADRFEKRYEDVFKSYLDAQFSLFRKTLNDKYQSSGVYPIDEASLQRLLYPAGITLENLMDPWGTPYRYSFGAQGDRQYLEVKSAGPDKRFDTFDDFTVNSTERLYFQNTGEAINRAIERYYARSGDYIRNAATLKEELKAEGINFDLLRDPWGNSYGISFSPSSATFSTIVKSPGPNGKFEPDNANETDDVTVWTNHFPYFATDSARIEIALMSEYEATKTFPQNEMELREALRKRGVDFSALRDPWNQNYYITLRNEARYADRATTINYIRYDEKQKQQQQQPLTKITPVTQQVQILTIRSKGQDGREVTWDDFTVGAYTRLISEQSADEPKPQKIESIPYSSGQTGSIAGTVTDPNGAVISNTTVKATHKETSREFSTTTNDEGAFILRGLPTGVYEVRFDASGFKTSVVTQVLVKTSYITTLNVTLEVGAISETVTITSESTTVMASTNASVSSTVRRSSAIIARPVPQISTPRLREYFPETLFWQPSIETDKKGRAHVRFKLADNITTWKMSVVGSTADGQIGVVEKEFLSFLPFFAEHDPPKVLTEGDEISLPVVFRNYTEKAQTVDVEMKPENWFSLLDPAHQSVLVPKSESKNAVFTFRAVASITDGKQRVTARGTDESDAIEKPVTVHPDGEEISLALGDVFTDKLNLEMNLPQDTIKNSQRASLKIYPNLMAHVVESIEGILHRPYGCGEQTISSTYPSILILKTQKSGNKVSSSVAEKANKYAREGYKRLLNYRSDDGGFTYWGRGEADIALTAYALRFLADAKNVIEIDDEVLKGARQWLINRQQPDGSWSSYNYTDDWGRRYKAVTTSYIARVLAMTADEVVNFDEKSNANQIGTLNFALKRVVAFLRPQVDELDEPYLLASYALAAIEAKETNEAKRIIARLEKLARNEGMGSYWSLEANTPFYGWGLAGRIETTALVIQALVRFTKLKTSNEELASGNTLINRGLLFLLKQKDAYGVWYSTQATINVLDALITLINRDERAPRAPVGENNAIEIYINGNRVSSLTLPSSGILMDPLAVDLSNALTIGNNRIELKAENNSSPVSAQLVTNYYIPWQKSNTLGQQQIGLSALRLSVNFDKTETRITEEITCNVEAERIAYRGYGMMLAEIGLPPGADVDRASLEKAMTDSGWSFSRYDVLPDRVIAYLWPTAGGVKFSFKFKPRYGIKALTAVSQLYDYYNPEAHVVLAPTKFVVR